MVSRFESGMRNTLGGSFNVFQRAPSSASVAYVRGKDGRKALRLSYLKEDKGFCGMWIHLFNSTSLPEDRTYLEATEFTYLAFWIRASKDAQVTVKIADAVWERKEDALEIGDVASFTQAGHLDTLWQQVVIPIERFPSRIMKNQLATLSFEVTSGLSGWIDISSLAFCRSQSELPLLPPSSTESMERRLNKGLWVWNTEKLYDDASERKALFEMIRNDNINHVFLAIPYHASRRIDSTGILIDRSSMRQLLSYFHRAGVKVHALLGDKDFILPDRRPFVRATLENILNYNKSVKPQERFYAIHFDVEPYLRPGFGGALHNSILENFLDLLADAASIAKRGNLYMGADIPFWLDSPDEFSQTKPFLTFRGAKKLVSEHVIDLLDFVTLMSYRTSAAGADGIVLHSTDELEYASRTGKRVFVGIETSPLPDENILTFRGAPSTGIPQGRAGRFFLCFHRGDTTYAMVGEGDKVPIPEDVLKSLGVDSTSVISWPIVQDIFVPRSKMTFASRSRVELKNIIAQVNSEFSSYPAFQGIAMHHFESYWQLLRKP